MSLIRLQINCEIAGHQATYYELEDNDAHGGATYYDNEVLNIIQKFCKEHTYYD